MYEAARLGDEIAHTSALAGFLIGAVAGIALVAAVAFATFTCGFGVALLAGLAAGLGGSLLTAAGEAIGRSFSSPAGAISTGSPDVFVNHRAAAFVEGSLGACDKHSGPVKVAEGSSNVFINSKPAARKGDKLTCGAVIDAGSPNVTIGGGQERYLPVDDEVPGWLRTTVDILMAIAGVASGIANLIRMGAQSGLKAAAPCALKFTAGFVAGEVAARYVAGPAIERAVGGLFGNPVDATTGRKLLTDETDFALPGLMPIAWTRFYASDLHAPSILGRGWILPWEQTLRREGELIYLRDNQGRDVPFVDLTPGERIFAASEQLYLVRSQGGHYLLQTLDNTFFYFGDLPDDGSAAPLLRIENALGHFLNLARDATGRLRDLTASGGIRLHLHYDDAGQRLARVVRVAGDQAAETLVSYQYTPDGQLSEVINRNGDSIRRFAYEDGLMVRHENALGLICVYRWAHIDGRPRVAEHTTSDGEHFRFHYDTAARTTRITEALGREAEIHYNDDRRVVASRDFGGEHYRIELDAAGNMTGLELPGGGRIALEYDKHSRLVAETDPLGRTTRYQHHYDTPLVTEVVYPDGSTWQARYDDQGNLLAETDAEGHTTEYLNGPDGLPHTIIDAHQRPKYLWWSPVAQVEAYQDCSGKQTRYTYDERHHLVAITDALGQTTRLTRKPAGEVLAVEHADGTRETFAYNAHGQLLEHTDGNGHNVRLIRTARGLPQIRRDAQGRLVRYEYDRALRLASLINENHAAYRFAYDASDRLLEEQRIDHLTRRFAYNVAGHLVGVEEIGYGTQGERPVRRTTFERDPIGRLLARINDDARYDYRYDDGDRLLAIERLPGEQGKRLGLQPDRLAFAYDRNGRLTGETGALGELAYQYDALGNLATLGLPDGRALNHLYYGSGHLHQINLDGRTVSDIERDDLHREILRTQGRLTSRTGYDALGRKAWQFASSLPADKLSSLHNPNIVVTDLIERRDNPIHRRYRYDAGGELVALRDKLRGDTHYAYDAAGRLLGRSAPDLAAREHFAYDPAANLVQPEGDTLGGHVKDNRLRTWQDQRYDYDPWGNLVTKRVGQHLEQRFAYDAENHLIHAATYRDGNLVSEGRYHYDSLGRRIAKVVEQDGKTKRTDFLWQGLRLLEERSGDGQKLYVYEPDSYAPLARIDGSGDDARLYYFHTDQIGTPLDVTDEDGQMVWQASYKAWGEVEQYHTQAIEQNLRFQGQYFDDETGLHYNTFRYYDPGVGRFVTQDPIGLLGGSNLYQYAPNALGWIDPLGWAGNPANATHITYEGIKDGKPYIGYASKPGLGHSADDVLKYRYPNTSQFDVAPQAVFIGNGQEGKNIARGLEQRIFEERGGLAGTSNKQNPVGIGNKNRATYLSAADAHISKNAATGRPVTTGATGC
ncbi:MULTISPECIES: RHS repeat-associated core domain-containing protein [unclassified Brenneria]|uniref:RHS repeat-associated core domain-containing protein n=1 Tax=unclassified Brenneria TaxID=2634434 RepID=UPI0018F066B8|nr:RHS repeat-associated core domain-containing protein [Brenneria sp. L3-3C-1]MBJ7223498.1 PAAR/RHS domain-containing protein [Brenneria sp. L3-3C-1]MEE3644739.1 RHS repeat-associated core domain-containing protein [Brenneria sp. L3_3C_1]